jgi:hypothetical protein
MGSACNTYGEKEVHRGFWWRNPRKGNYFEDPDVDGRMI